MFEFHTELIFEEFNGIIFFGVLFSVIMFIAFEALKKFFDRSIS